MIKAQDMKILRPLAAAYADIASLDVQKERLARYTATNSLEIMRPIVLISEIPWGEIHDQTLVNQCSPELRWIEEPIRHALYQWTHFQVDLVLPPVFRVGKKTRSTGIGLSVHDKQIKGDTGAYIASHEYTDQLQSEDDLNKLCLPEISYDSEATELALAQAGEVFEGLMNVETCGTLLQANIWDEIAMFRGVDNLLMDLVMRPEFMHQTAQRFMEIAESRFSQYEKLDLLDANPLLLHCTPACTRELPAPDYTGKVRMKDVWGRCAAQIFGAVSPEMHDEFDLAYNEKLFGKCGLVYYGCCEPMDNKIDILRRRFRNLRKVSITPWANTENAARNIGADFVLAAKPNPAFVSRPQFNPAPVEQEIERYCRACLENKTPLEFVLKDISTIANDPGNLTQWAETVNRVIDRHYT